MTGNSKIVGIALTLFGVYENTMFRNVRRSIPFIIADSGEAKSNRCENRDYSFRAEVGRK